MSNEAAVQARARAVAILAIALVVVAVAYFAFLRGGSTYTVNAVFRDAGQLISGDRVEVGGVPVGKIASMKVTPDGNADLVLSIARGRFTPLHQGTTASIGTVGLAGIANRFVAINPGPQNTATIPDGGTLDETGTTPIIDLDELLNSLTPKVISNLQGVIKLGAQAFSSPAAASQAFLYLDPALGQTASFIGQLVSDKRAFSNLISSAATISSTLAAHNGDLANGITNTSTTLRSIASESRALQDTLSRAPGVLSHATGTLASLRSALGSLNPTLRAAQPSARPLARVLREAVPTGRHVIPVVRQLLATLPAAEQALNGLPGLRNAAVPVLGTLTTTFQALTPIASGLRQYEPDVVAGLFHGLAGNNAGNYDANGHYVIVGLGTGAGFAGAGSLDQLLNSLLGSVPTLSGYRSGLTARCPGAAAAPAGDSSSPYVSDPSLCDPSQNALPDH